MPWLVIREGDRHTPGTSLCLLAWPCALLVSNADLYPSLSNSDPAFKHWCLSHQSSVASEGVNLQSCCDFPSSACCTNPPMGSFLQSQTWPPSQLTPLEFLEDTWVGTTRPVSYSCHSGTILISLLPAAPHFNHMTMLHWWFLWSGHYWWNYSHHC